MKHHLPPPTSRKGEDFLETAKARTSNRKNLGPFPHQGCSRARSRTMPAPQRSPTRSLQWFRSCCGTAASLPLGSHHYARDSRFPRAGLKPAPCSASAEQRTATAGPRERSKSQRKPRNALLPPASKGQRCPTGSGREGAGWDGRSRTRDPHPTHLSGAGSHRPPSLQIPRPA